MFCLSVLHADGSAGRPLEASAIKQLKSSDPLISPHRLVGPQLFTPGTNEAEVTNSLSN